MTPQALPHRPDRSWLSVIELLHEALAALPAGMSRGEVHVEEGLPPVYADREHMRRAIIAVLQHVQRRMGNFGYSNYLLMRIRTLTGEKLRFVATLPQPYVEFIELEFLKELSLSAETPGRRVVIIRGANADLQRARQTFQDHGGELHVDTPRNGGVRVRCWIPTARPTSVDAARLSQEQRTPHQSSSSSDPFSASVAPAPQIPYDRRSTPRMQSSIHTFVTLDAEPWNGTAHLSHPDKFPPEGTSPPKSFVTGYAIKPDRRATKEDLGWRMVLSRLATQPSLCKLRALVSPARNGSPPSRSLPERSAQASVTSYVARMSTLPVAPSCTREPSTLI